MNSKLHTRLCGSLPDFPEMPENFPNFKKKPNNSLGISDRLLVEVVINKKNEPGGIITIITFSHHKGGTGKTTSCLNIAGFCHQMGRKVLVVDCDPQANATAGLGIDPSASGKNMYDVFMSGIDDFPRVGMEDIVRKTASGIDLAPSHLDLVGAEPYLYHAAFPTGCPERSSYRFKKPVFVYLH